jgi:hypothetical protein
MIHYTKKNRFETSEEARQPRFQRKFRSHKLTRGGDKFERRHSWGYAKRRALLAE